MSGRSKETDFTKRIRLTSGGNLPYTLSWVKKGRTFDRLILRKGVCPQLRADENSASCRIVTKLNFLQNYVIKSCTIFSSESSDCKRGVSHLHPLETHTETLFANP